MLKILIIDDDALTRKGIRMLMPWASHNMEIVGEASNGKLALDFLHENEADLALVDLDMPVMNGITFIQKASELYPQLNYVVLTIHTEFEYIQNVLRLGAIDYIAKTRFDQENFDGILDRINSSIAKKNALLQSIPSFKWKESKILYPYIYVLITIESENDEQIFNFWELNGLSGRTDIFELMSGIWIFTDDRKTFLFPDPFTNTTLLCISDVAEMTFAELGKLLRTYVRGPFFYDYQPLKQINYKRAYELMEEEFLADEATLDRLKQDWISLNWIHENELFNKIKIDLKSSKLKLSQLYHLLLSLETVWNAAYGGLTGHTLSLPAAFHHWSEVEEWLSQLYEKVNLFSTSSKYSEDVTKNILLAKQYVDTHFNAPIDTTEVARNAHMSYGYFSRCFHDIIGMSFSDYCIQIRIRKAKDYLLNTGYSIQQIADDVGYNDEKYFSRLFKKITGISPTEYRKNGKESSE